MTVTFRTIVLHMPVTPLGLIPESWAVEHWCKACRQRVATDGLIAHAQTHAAVPSDGGLMSSLGACPVCGTPRPIDRLGSAPWCCSIACYRSFHDIDEPATPPCQDGVTAIRDDPTKEANRG